LSLSSWLDVDEVWGTRKRRKRRRGEGRNAAYDLKATAGRKDDKKEGLMLKSKVKSHVI